MRMKKCMLIGLICLLSSQWMWGQHFPQMDARNYVSDTALFIPRRPWLAASEVFGMNMAVWTFDRFLMNEDFAKINGHTIKQNFKTGPVWDTDKFSTNLVAHPYHGSLYFNAARSNGLNFWQSIPFATGEAWRHSSSKGRVYTSVPVNFIVGVGPRFLAEQEGSKHGTTSMHVSFRLDYGDPFNDDFYSPYEWFQLKAGFDFFSSQPLISQVNAVGAIWGKQVWSKGPRSLAAGIFQHFDYYDSELKSNSSQTVAPYRISEAAAVGGGLIYYKRGTPDNKVDVYAELYGTGVALGASISDYLRLEERDYNLGSGYSVKAFTGLAYDKRWAFLIDLENYHIFTWKGYEPDIDWNAVDPTKLNVQGDAGNARLTVFSTTLAYMSKHKWNIALRNRYFSRRTHYKYHKDIDSSTYDIMLTLGWRI